MKPSKNCEGFKLLKLKKNNDLRGFKMKNFSVICDKKFMRAIDDFYENVDKKR